MAISRKSPRIRLSSVAAATEPDDLNICDMAGIVLSEAEGRQGKRRGFCIRGLRTFLSPGVGSLHFTPLVRGSGCHWLLWICWIPWALVAEGDSAVPPPILTNEVEFPLRLASPQPLNPTFPRLPSSDPPPVVPSLPLVLPQASPWPTQALKGTWIPLREWAHYIGASAPKRVADKPNAAYELKAKRGSLVFRVGSSRVSAFSTDVMLGQLPQFIAGEPCAHRLDLEKTLFPLLWPSSTLLATTNRFVVLDPGHGGKDSGTQSFDARYYEKSFTLDWALRTKALLEARGIPVLLTRTNDQEVSLAQRVFIAEEAKAAVFVSLHFNSATPLVVRRGLEVYALTPPGMISSVVREGEDNPRLSFPNNHFDPSNTLLAWLIQRAVVQSSGAYDRGVQRARFMGVLRGQKRPAVLVEGGYLSHLEESRRISEAGYRQKLAEGVAKGIEQFFELPE